MEFKWGDVVRHSEDRFLLIVGADGKGYVFTDSYSSGENVPGLFSESGFWREPYASAGELEHKYSYVMNIVDIANVVFGDK